MFSLFQHVLIKHCQVKTQIMLKCAGRNQTLLILPAAHAMCVTADKPGNGERNFPSFSTIPFPNCVCLTSLQLKWTGLIRSCQNLTAEFLLLQGKKLKMRQGWALQSTEWATAWIHGLSCSLACRTVSPLNTFIPVPFQKLWMAVLHIKDWFIQLPK